MRGSTSLALRLARIFCAAALILAPVASMAQAAANPALWRVRHDTSTLYLFGSLHVLPEGYVWTTPEIEAAKAAADSFIFEVPVDDEALKEERQFIVENGLLSKRQTLRGALSGGEFQTYSAVLRRAGMKQEQFERFRPWLAAVVLGLAYLHSDDINSLKGADDALMDYARAHGRPLHYLEGVRDQMELLTRGKEADQLKALKSLIVALPRARNQERDLLGKWSSGDAEALTALLGGYFSGHAGAQELLIDSRNRKWLPAIKQSLARPNGTTMLTVGAAHIGGRNGLIALLCGEGYVVERMQMPESGENACGPES